MTTHPAPPERELVALLELSERATPGIWEMYGGTNHGRVQTADVIVCDGSPPHFMGKEDAKFIAALVNWFRSTRAATVPQGDALDARRYRWLRANACEGRMESRGPNPDFALNCDEPESEWDAAIDAAMTPQQGG